MTEWGMIFLGLAQIISLSTLIVARRKQRQINANADERFRILENWVVKLIEERYANDPIKGEKGCQ